VDKTPGISRKWISRGVLAYGLQSYGAAIGVLS
jgi:hypothetical protein